MKHSVISTSPRERQLVRAVRMATRDNMMTFDSNRAPVYDTGSMVHPSFRGAPIIAGSPLGYGAAGGQVGVRTHDGRVVDSTGSFLVGELERLDLTMHEPLYEVSYGRDIDMREDVTIADEVSSFTLTTFGSAGGLGSNGIGNGKAWIGKTSDQIGGVSVDISKVPHQLDLWGLELKYSIPELESAARLGRPIDDQKYQALQVKYQMDVDEQIYIGDTSKGAKGMVNSDLVTPAAVAQGAGGSTLWSTKTPDEILLDVNTAITTVWKASAWKVMPERLMLPPDQFGYISTQKVALAGNISILKYLAENNVLTTSSGKKLDILPLKWLIGSGSGGTVGTSNGKDRMMVYTKDKKRIRFPMTPLSRTSIQYESIYHKSTYFGRLGQVELVYPETVGYFDGL